MSLKDGSGAFLFVSSNVGWKLEMLLLLWWPRQ